MRISKKDKVDVKRFMEEIKANKTNRSIAQTETKIKPPVEAITFPQQRYVPKYFGLPNQRDIYRPPISYQDPQRYLNVRLDTRNQQADYRIPQAYSNPYISKRSMNDMMSQQSQHFNVQLPFQHPTQAMMNYSQSYSSPNFFPYYNQAAQINENSYSQFLLHQKSQMKHLDNRESIKNKQYNSLQKLAKESVIINEPKCQINLEDEQITQSKHNQNQNLKFQTLKKRSISQNNIQKKQLPKIQTEAPKKRKPKEKKKAASPKKKEQNFFQIETEKKNQARTSSMSISKKFDEIMEREKKKIEEKLQHQRKIKQIMINYNRRIQTLGQQFFSKQLIESINNFKQRVFTLIENYEEKCNEQFNQNLIF